MFLDKLQQTNYTEEPVRSQNRIAQIWARTRYFGTFGIIEQRRIRRFCAYAQTRQSLRCSHTQSSDINPDSDQKSDF